MTPWNNMVLEMKLVHHKLPLTKKLGDLITLSYLLICTVLDKVAGVVVYDVGQLFFVRQCVQVLNHYGMDLCNALTVV